jgi:hypothetical protein
MMESLLMKIWDRPRALMPAIKPVRIIERKERQITIELAVIPPAKTERQLQRDMERTVTAWIFDRREVVREFTRSDIVRGLLGSRSILKNEGG